MKSKIFDEVKPYSYLLIRKSDNKKYVGVRYANVKLNLTPNQDFGKVYFTSGSLKKEFKKNPEGFTFRLAYSFDSLDEMFEWERKITLKIYKRGDWANNGWSTNYKDNPIIGSLISEGKNKTKKSGLTSVEQGAIVLKEWIWNTEEGERHREDISSRQKEAWANRTEEERKNIASKRVANMDFKAAREKARIKLDAVGEDGLTGNQRNGRKAKETRKMSGIDSEIGKKRNEKYNIKLGEMSDVEFEEFCKGKALCFVNGAITRRNRYLSREELTTLP